jgi:hypothetical protein
VALEGANLSFDCDTLAGQDALALDAGGCAPCKETRGNVQARAETHSEAEGRRSFQAGRAISPRWPHRKTRPPQTLPKAGSFSDGRWFREKSYNNLEVRRSIVPVRRLSACATSVEYSLLLGKRLVISFFVYHGTPWLVNDLPEISHLFRYTQRTCAGNHRAGSSVSVNSGSNFWLAASKTGFGGQSLPHASLADLNP